LATERGVAATGPRAARDEDGATPRRRTDVPAFVLGSFVPFSARLFEPSARRFGMVVAHDQLLKHLLLGGAVAGAEIFASSVLARQYASERGRCEAAIQEQFGTETPRPQFRPLTDLPAAACKQRYCFLSTGNETHRLGQLRWALPDNGHSIVTVVHAVTWMDAVANYLGLAAVSNECDAIVATSRAAEGAVRALLNWATEIGQTPVLARVVRIPFGIDLPREPMPDKVSSRHILGLPVGGDVLLYVGRLTDEYKADLSPLLSAMWALHRKRPSLHLVIAGHDQGKYGEVVRAEARAVGIASRVTVIEDPSDPVKELLLSAADIFVSPADNIQESFGLSLLEAMAHRLPVIASDWSGYRDLVADGASGFLIPTYWSPEAADAASLIAPLDVSYGIPHLLARHSVMDHAALISRIDTLLGDVSLRLTMGTAARTRVATEFSWRSVVDQYRELLDEAATRERPNDRRRCPISFNDLFAAYASHTLTSDTWVTRGDDTAPFRPAGDAVSELWQRIVALDNVPRRLSDLEDDARCADRSALITLIKKGRLRIVAKND
jgi:glycosyltransferase involved in cell wall biosynthesis